MTKIEWTDETWNPVTGCTPISEGCANCYAKRMAKRLQAMGQKKYRNAFEVTCHPDTLEEPLHWKKPRNIFVCSMSDLFHESVPFEFVRRVFQIIDKCQQHTFQILTKRPEMMLKFYNTSIDGISWHLPRKAYTPLSNLWIGVTAENQLTADERIPLLLQCPAAVRFVSIEPMLGPVDVERYLRSCRDCGNAGSEAMCLNRPGSGNDLCRACDKGGEGPSLDWVIVGGESGPGARPMELDWARKIRDDCQEAGVNFFMKQMSGRTAKERHAIPEDLMIKEYPDGKGRYK